MSGWMPRAGRALAAMGVVAAVVAAPIAAQADENPPSDWWYDGFGVSEVHSQGWTGAGVKIAVIDTQINPDLPVFEGANLTVADPLCEGSSPTSSKPTEGAVHGSDMVALLVGNGAGTGHIRGIVPDAAVTFYGISDCGRGGDDTHALYAAIDRAVDAGNQVISTSLGTTADGGGASRAIAEAVAKGVVVVAASPNTVNDAKQMWPWGFNGVVSVNAFGQDGKLQEDHEIAGKQVAWKETTVVAPGVDFPSVDWSGGVHVLTGSSLATPLTAGIVALAAQKFPGVSGNQLIQSLIHNTTPDDHPLSRSDDGNGYGPVSLRHVLAVDPSQYPDVNPLMDKSSGQPTVQQVAQAAGGASPAPVASPTQTDAASGPVEIDAGGGVWVPVLVGAGVVVLLVVVAVIVIVIVASGRKKNRNAGGAA